MSAQVHEAISRIEPLTGDGPNRFTADVHGWSLSAPTTRQLKRMLWEWFNPRQAEPMDGEYRLHRYGEAA